MVREHSLLSDTERMLIYKVSIDDKATIYWNNHGTYMQDRYYSLRFFLKKLDNEGGAHRAGGGRRREGHQ